MNLLSKLQNLTDLSHSEQLLVDFILKNPDKVLNMSARECAEACFVSAPTLYRLCSKLGLSGFSDFKVQLSTSLKDFIARDDFDFDYPVNQDQSGKQILYNLQEDYEKTVQETINLFDLNVLNRAVRAMKRARVIDVYTSAGNIFFAQNFQFQMKEIGVDVNVPVDEYMQRLSAAGSDPDHFAILISFGGRGAVARQLAHILQEKEAKILLISSNEFCMEDFKPDYQLFMSSHENHYNKISSYSTRLTLLYILDVLYTCYFQLDYDRNVEKKLTHYHFISKDYSKDSKS